MIRVLLEAAVEEKGFQGAILWDASKPDFTPEKHLQVRRLASLGLPARIQLAEGLASTVALFPDKLIAELMNLL